MGNMEKVRMLDFQQRGDERGHLVVVEGGVDIPFEIRRAFYIYGSGSDVVRGQHANRRTEFVLINVAGTSKVKVKDGEGNEEVYCLGRPPYGDLPASDGVEGYVWVQQGFRPACPCKHPL